MTWGLAGMQHPSLAAMIAAIEACITRVALHRRFSKSAADFLLTCLQFVLQHKFVARSIDTPLLRRFSRVLLTDSSRWDVHGNLRHVLAGSGGDASAASCKLQAVYDYQHGQLTFLDVTPGILPDNRYTDRLSPLLNPGDLLLLDQGYFQFKTFQQIIAKAAFFLTRFSVRVKLRDAFSLEPFDLAERLRALAGNAHDMRVVRGDGEAETVSGRLVALRAREQVANERRRRLRKEARKKGRMVSRRHLDLCDGTLLITHVPVKDLPMERVRALYTLRGPIERLFKQLKSVLRIHRCDTAPEHRLRCELYGKRIVAVLFHRIHAAANALLWKREQREVSMDKLYQRLPERAFEASRHLLRSARPAIVYLRAELARILPFCRKGRQRSRQTTLEMIETQLDPIFSVATQSQKECR